MLTELDASERDLIQAFRRFRSMQPSTAYTLSLLTVDAPECSINLVMSKNMRTLEMVTIANELLRVAAEITIKVIASGGPGSGAFQRQLDAIIEARRTLGLEPTPPQENQS